VNPKTLLAESRQWNRSQLSVKKRPLDLVAILKEFHVQMLQSYAIFVAKTFFPELQPADEFYARLVDEVHKRHPNARMLFFSRKPKMVSKGGGKQAVKFNFIMAPNDVFGELGIKVDRSSVAA
jgi:hypothetical protein